MNLRRRARRLHGSRTTRRAGTKTTVLATRDSGGKGPTERSRACRTLRPMARVAISATYQRLLKEHG